MKFQPDQVHLESETGTRFVNSMMLSIKEDLKTDIPETDLEKGSEIGNESESKSESDYDGSGWPCFVVADDGKQFVSEEKTTFKDEKHEGIDEEKEEKEAKEEKGDESVVDRDPNI